LQHKLPGYAMLAVLIGGLSMVSPFSIDTFFPAFHSMERALHVDAWKLQQVITAYMVPFAFASLVHGPIVGCDRAPPGDDLGHGAVHRGLGGLHIGA
jgi:DHA1 family bicyclomycin/chloramphenicol resistance-like MFS transporter